jgi:hypothetical protein
LNAIAAKVKHEVAKLLPPTIFFFIAFHLLALSRSLMLRQYGVSMSAVAGATVGALVAGKVVLIADMLPFMHRFPNRPLIYNVVWKTMIYLIAASVIRYLEHLIPVWWRTGDLDVAYHRLREEVIWPHFWMIQLWLLVLLFMYSFGHELVRLIGPDEVRRMFFGVPGRAGP